MTRTSRMLEKVKPCVVAIAFQTRCCAAPEPSLRERQAPAASAVRPFSTASEMRPSRPIGHSTVVPPTHCARQEGAHKPYATGLSRRSSPTQALPEIARLDSMETRQHNRSSNQFTPPPIRGDVALTLFAPKGADAQKSVADLFSTQARQSGGQTRFPSHLRRQICGNFHARANFGDDRSIPGHESNSSSFSPRGHSCPTDAN
jgi:hypothetical protein